jgi:hypothetical protein
MYFEPLPLLQMMCLLPAENQSRSRSSHLTLILPEDVTNPMFALVTPMSTPMLIVSLMFKLRLEFWYFSAD